MPEFRCLPIPNQEMTVKFFVTLTFSMIKGNTFNRHHYAVQIRNFCLYLYRFHPPLECFLLTKCEDINSCSINIVYNRSNK